MEADLRVNFPGLLIERHRNGAALGVHVDW